MRGVRSDAGRSLGDVGPHDVPYAGATTPSRCTGAALDSACMTCCSRRDRASTGAHPTSCASGWPVTLRRRSSTPGRRPTASASGSSPGRSTSLAPCSSGTSTRPTGTAIRRSPRSSSRWSWCATAGTARHSVPPTWSALGFTAVADLVGGMHAWIESGNPVVVARPLTSRLLSADSGSSRPDTSSTIAVHPKVAERGHPTTSREIVKKFSRYRARIVIKASKELPSVANAGRCTIGQLLRAITK